MIVIFFIGIWGALLGVLISASPAPLIPALADWQNTPRFTRGSCQSLLLVSVLQDGVRSGGVLLEWVFTSHGQVLPDLTCK